MERMHSLLKRQLRKLFGSEAGLAPEVARLVEVVEESYRYFDSDRELLHRSMELSSEELTEANTEIRAVLQSIPDLIVKIKADGQMQPLKSLASTTSGEVAPASGFDRWLGAGNLTEIPVVEVRDQFAHWLKVVLEEKRPATFSYATGNPPALAYFEVRFVPLVEGQSVIAIIRNVTERRQAEAEHVRLNRELIEASRLAGMAEVATGVLHNVGNVLNSVNVSALLVHDLVRRSKVARLGDSAALLREHADDLSRFLTENPRGRILPAFLVQLAEHLMSEREGILEELSLLARNVEHIKEIVALQQNYAKVSGVTEVLSPIEVIEDVLRMNEAGFLRHGIQVVREFADVPPITIDRHKVMQVLVNLVRNAKHALQDGRRPDKRLRVRIHRPGPDRIAIEIEDNGVGIAPENLTRIFGHGFTTKRDGHGFGLHSGALAAKELGGALRVTSDGLGTGACFTLELPAPARSPVSAESSPASTGKAA